MCNGCLVKGASAFQFVSGSIIQTFRLLRIKDPV